MSAETFEERIPLAIPERSFTSELLEKPVPIENRIEYLSAYVIPSTKARSEKEIADTLEITQTKVRSVAEAIGLGYAEENQGTVYPPFSLELIEEEIEWEATFAELNEYVSAKTLASVLGREERWVRHKANELAVFPEYRPTRSGRYAHAYPKSLAGMLRHIMLQTPPAGEWSNLRELEEDVGRDREWIKARLDQAGFEPQSRMAHGNHTVVDHYPPEAVKYLLACKESTPPAGDWVTKQRIADLIGRDLRWVIARIEEYEQLGEERLDDTGKAEIHFPPFVLDELRAQNNELQSYAEAGDYFSTKALAQKIGRSVLWVRNRVSEHDIKFEVRRNGFGRLYEYYSPSTLTFLQTLSEDEQKTKNQE